MALVKLSPHLLYVKEFLDQEFFYEHKTRNNQDFQVFHSFSKPNMFRLKILLCDLHGIYYPQNLHH